MALADEPLRALHALGFLTRLPVPAAAWGAPGGLAAAARWFPLAGAAVGLAAALVYAAAAALPAPVAALLALAASLALTGALHEDGLADTLDALGGHATRERALEILRDSRIGTYGALALILSVALRAACLASLSPAAALAALPAAHAAGRAAMLLAPAGTPYARPAGLGAPLQPLPKATLPAALALAALLALPAGLPGLLAFAAALAAAALVLAGLRARLGGWTGDGLGAMEQAGEIAALLTLTALLA
ncbi:MAG: adenosylcobinamide-GDP ribazoletransferase [Paracoccaceae bacterium]